jgi:glycine hydroxymethyltransferase
MTTRGFGIAETEELTGWMCDVLENIEDESVIKAVKEKVVELCGRFPLEMLSSKEAGADQ